jgi:hypothetical protein
MSEDDIAGLMTCGWCYKWLGAWHRLEDCPRKLLTPSSGEAKDEVMTTTNEEGN